MDQYLYSIKFWGCNTLTYIERSVKHCLPVFEFPVIEVRLHIRHLNIALHANMPNLTKLQDLLWWYNHQTFCGRNESTSTSPEPLISSIRSVLPIFSSYNFYSREMHTQALSYLCTQEHTHTHTLDMRT